MIKALQTFSTHKTQTFSAFRRPRCSLGRLTFLPRDTVAIGTVPRKRDTRVLQFSVSYGLGIPEHDTEGRAITLEYDDFFLVCVYTPNAQKELARLDYRMTWEDALRGYLLSLDARKPVIYCGDLNVAHEEIDLKNPKTNHFSAGFSDQERAKFTQLLDSGFKDTFRTLYPDTVKYSWWSYMYHAREKNVGWRIDYFVVSERLMARVKDSVIFTDILGSDHCPVGIEI